MSDWSHDEIGSLTLALSLVAKQEGLLLSLFLKGLLSLVIYMEGIFLFLDPVLGLGNVSWMLLYRFLSLGLELLRLHIKNLWFFIIIIRVRLFPLRFSIELFRFRNHFKITLKIINRNITSIQLYKLLLIRRILRLGDHHRQRHITHNSLICITHHLIMKKYLQRIEKCQ